MVAAAEAVAEDAAAAVVDAVAMIAGVAIVGARRGIRCWIETAASTTQSRKSCDFRYGLDLGQHHSRRRVRLCSDARC